MNARGAGGVGRRRIAATLSPRAARAWWSSVLVAVLALLGVAPAALGHPAVSTTARVKIEASGRVTILVHHDVLAFALDDSSENVPDAAMNELLHSTDEVVTRTLADARDRFQTLFVLMVDGQRLPVQIDEFPSTAGIREWEREHPGRRLPIKMDITASAMLPEGASAVTVRFPDVLSDVILLVDRPDAEPFNLPLRAGATSPPIEVRVGAGGQASGEHRQLAAPVGVLGVILRYTVLGFTHIIPGGPDHALFVLGLFLLSPRPRLLLWQITFFTIAHSVTLTLAALHLVNISPRVVEPTIAATIAFIGIENLFTTKVHAWRPLVAFAFGLIHGLGFASALGEVGLPTGQLTAGLVGFSIGVECGHIVTLGAAFLALGWFVRKPWYRKRLAIPLSLVIAGIAVFWMVQRLIAPG